jgi:hypothetical protein
MTDMATDQDMPAVKAVDTALDDLDRDELMQILRDHLGILEAIPTGRLFVPTQRDVGWARWQVASRRAGAASEKAFAEGRKLAPLAEAVDCSWRTWHEAVEAGRLPAADKAMRRFRRAREAYEAADAVRRRLETRADRLRRQADRLYQDLETKQGHSA